MGSLQILGRDDRCFEGRMKVKGGEESDSSMKNYRVGDCQCDRPAMSTSWQLWKLGFYLPTETGRRPILPYDHISQESGSQDHRITGFQILKKNTLVIGSTYTSLRDRNNFHNCKPFFVNALRKGCQVLATINSKFC